MSFPHTPYTTVPAYTAEAFAAIERLREEADRIFVTPVEGVLTVELVDYTGVVEAIYAVHSDGEVGPASRVQVDAAMAVRYALVEAMAA